MDKKTIAAMIDHTLLKPEATPAQIEKLCAEAAEYHFASVCVNPVYIPLAARLLAKQVEVITPRGQPMTEANIGERLAIRDFLDTLRGSGIQSCGPAAMSLADKQQFANALDRWLVEAQRRNPPQKG